MTRAKAVLPLAVACAAALLASLILLGGNWDLLHTDVIPNGDAAADELLLISARHGVLLHGHYSRFNFNHPGPFFFQARLLADHVAAGLFPGPYTLHAAALMLVNCLFIGLAAAAAYLLAGAGVGGWLAALGCVAAVMFQFHDSGAGITSSWMPDVIRMPYLAFLLNLLLMARGSVFGLLAATFCGGALVHGYVAMPAFVAPPFVLALAIGLFGKPRFPKGALIAAALIVLLFVAPMMVEMLARPPGNIGLILDYIRESAAHKPEPNPSREIITGVLLHWKTIHPLLWAPPALALLLDLRRRRDLAGWLILVLFSALSGALFLVYLRTAPPPLYDYIGYFHESLPLSLVVWGIVRLAGHSLDYKPAAALAVLLCLAGLAFGGGHAAYRGVPEIRNITQAIVARHPDGQVMLRMANFDEWNLMTGVMADLNRFDVDSCTPFLYPGMPEQSITHHRLCPEARPNQQRYVLAAQGACGPACLASSPLGSIAVDDQEPAIISGGDRHRFVFSLPPARRILGAGWSSTEAWGLWSDGGHAEIHLEPADLGPGAATIQIDVSAFLAGKVMSLDMPVTVNGKEVDRWHFDESRNRDVRSLSLPPSKEPVVIGFDGIGEQSPKMAGISEDQRRLGLALYSLTIATSSAP